MGDTGLEPPSVSGRESNDLGQSSGAGAAKSDASDRKNAATDPDLQSVVDAWPTLPDAVKAGILAMVRASSDRGRTE
jgi:hypothetical protein